MNMYLRKALSVSAVVLIVMGLLLLPSFHNIASAQPSCVVTVCKSAPQLSVPESKDEFVFFPFTVISGQVTEPFELIANSRCLALGLNTGQGLEVIEEPLDGWKLSDIDCESVAGIGVTIFEDGASLQCNSEGQTTCTFTNFRSINIPTLSEWGMIAAAAGLALIGVFFAVRRRKAQTA